MELATVNLKEADVNANVAGKARPLHGMKAICAYLGVSENTVRKYVKEEKLPVGRMGGILVSDEEKIDGWRLGRIK